MNEKKDVQQIKKSYATPVVSAFGNIRSITQNVGQTGAPDGQGNQKTKA